MISALLCIYLYIKNPHASLKPIPIGGASKGSYHIMEQPITQHTADQMPQQPNPQQIPQQPINIPAPTPAPTIYSNPVSVIGPQYCLPYPVDLSIVRKFLTLTDGSFAVTDINDNLMFKVKEKLISLHDKRTLLDPAGNPIVTITEKVHAFISVLYRMRTS